MSKPKYILLAVLGLMIFAAGNINADVRTSRAVTISADEVIDDDLYIFAETITVDGIVKGDLVAFGRTVAINGTIEGDLTASGQNVTLTGKVQDDARIGGQTIILSGNSDVGDDLIAAGYGLEFARQSHVGGDLKFAGYSAELAGDVEKNVQAALGICQLSGRVGGNVELAVDGGYDPTTPGLAVSEAAQIAGDLEYRSTRKGQISPEASIAGQINFEELQSPVAEPPTVVDRSLTAAKQFFALFVVGLVVALGFPRWTQAVTQIIQKRPVASLGWGLLTVLGVIAGSIAMLLATVAVAIALGYVFLESLIPAWLGLGIVATSGLLIGWAVFAIWVAKVLVGVWAGTLIFNRTAWTGDQVLFSLIIGLILIVALCAIPYAGSVFSLVASLVGLGAATIWLFSSESELPTESRSIPIKHASQQATTNLKDRVRR